MQELYNTYFNPASDRRARISVHLHARGAVELDTKIVDLLQKLDLNEVPVDKRQSLDQLEGYLKDEQKLSADKTTTLISEAKELGLKQAAPDAEPPATTNGVSAVESAVEITDVRLYKASLQASVGARPVKDLSEYEETDAKL